MRHIAIDIETTVLNGEHASPYQDKIHCMAVNDNGNCYLIEDEDRIVELEDILLDPNIIKIFHGGSFDIQFLLHRLNCNRLFDCRVINIWDTLIAERLLTAGTNEPCDLGSVAFKYCEKVLDKEARKSFLHHSGMLNTRQKQYALEDVAYLIDIKQKQEKELTQRGMLEIMDIENKVTPLVAEMELAGICFDAHAWEKIVEEEQRVIPILEKKLQLQLSDTFSTDLFTGQVRGTVNLNSPLQLTAALSKLGIEVGNTNEATLKSLTHPIGQEILDHREHVKRLQWDYPKYVNPVTGKIHPTIVQTGADTGRFSCKNPNLQQVPHDQLFRDMFVSAPGCVFVVADYGQQELRVLAEYCQDPNLLKACREKDPHLENARVIYSDPTIQKSDNRRRVAKSCSFALVYGASYKTLGRSAGLDNKEAKKVHKLLHQTYHGVDVWGNESWEFLKSHGYITTLGGRCRYFPWVSRDPGKYITIARNSPIQGSSADMMKLALILVDKYARPLGGRLVLTIHDEIIVECPEDVSKDVARQVEKGMIEAGDYYVKSVPNIAEAGISKVWRK